MARLEAERGHASAGAEGQPVATAKPRAPAVLFVVVFLFALSLPAFLQQALGTRISDIPSQFSLEQPSSVYSLLILLVWGIIWTGAGQVAMGWIASVILSACVALKGALAFWVLSKNTERTLLAASLAVALAVVMPIANWWKPSSIYLGQFAPTVWHNPTTIVAMPASILLFLACLRSLDAPTLRNSAWASALCVLSAATKPAYLIVVLPVFLLWFCWRGAAVHGMSFRRLAIHVAILLGPVALVVLVQSMLVVTYRHSWITFAPFAVWSLYSPHPLASVLLSVAFPLAVTLCYLDLVRASAAIVLAWLTFVVALAVLILFAEEGARFSHGNMFWGAFMANYMLFLATADVFFRQPLSAKFVPVLALFLLHLASGLYFYWRTVMGLGFY